MSPRSSTHPQLPPTQAVRSGSCHHRRQAHLPGKYGSPESWEKYHRIIAERLNGEVEMGRGNAASRSPVLVRRDSSERMSTGLARSFDEH